MEYSKIGNMKISRLTLGTAQLGFNYGIANTKGKPSLEKSHEILKLAAENGINCFDTAPSYGDSEKILGSFITNNRQLSPPPVIVTKLPPVKPDGEPSFQKIYSMVKKQVTNSLNRLNITKIPIYLLHDASDTDAFDGLVMKSLLKLRDEGLIGVLGASTYDPEEVERVMVNSTMKAIQIPINVFDQRLIRTGMLEQLKKRGYIVFARSVFLQGLFFLNVDELPPHLKPAKPYLKQLQGLATEYNISVAQLALAFARDLPGITSVVIGAETPEQVRQNIELMNSPPFPSQLKNEVSKVFSNVPREITDPRTWSPVKAGGAA